MTVLADEPLNSPDGHRLHLQLIGLDRKLVGPKGFESLTYCYFGGASLSAIGVIALEVVGAERFALPSDRI